MKDNKKNRATLILSAGKTVERPQQDGAEMDQVDDKMIAVDEMFRALESKNKRDFAEALKSYVEMCMDGKEDESEKY